MSHSRPGPPLFPDDSRSESLSVHLQGLSSGPVVSMSDLLSQGPEPVFSILSLCAMLSLGRNSHPSSASQAAKSSPGNFPQLCPDDLHPAGPQVPHGFSTIFQEHLQPLLPTPPHRWDPCPRPFCIPDTVKAPLFLWGTVSFQPALHSTKMQSSVR